MGGRALRCRPGRACPYALRRARQARSDERGLSLVELGVALGLLGVFCVVAMITLSTFLTNANRVSGTYAGEDNALPVTNTLDRYFRSAVEPEPGVPAFQVANATQLKFTTNTGNPNGPELVDAYLTGAGPTSTFEITVTPPDPGSCPINGVGGPCTWSTTPPAIASVPNVPTAGGLTFYYLPLDVPPLTAPGTTSCSYTPPSSSSVWPPPPSAWPPSSGGWTLPVWTSTPVQWCWIATPLDQVWALALNLVVQSPSGGAQASRQFTTFLLSPTSYQFSPSVR